MNWLQAGAAVLMCLPAATLAMNKCVAPNGKVTYQQEPCPAESGGQVIRSSGVTEGDTAEAVWLRSEAAMHKGDLAEVRKHMTKEHQAALDKMDKKTAETQFAMMRELTPKNPKVIDRQVSADGKKTTLKATGMAKNATGASETWYGTVEMLKEGNTWKVDTSSWAPKP